MLLSFRSGRFMLYWHPKSDSMTFRQSDATTNIRNNRNSDVWLTVHRNSVWKRNQVDVTLCYPLFLLYKFLNMFRATMCPSSGADDCVVLSSRVGIVPWLQEACQNRLVVSLSIEEHNCICATNSSMHTLPTNRFWQPSCSHGTTSTRGDNTTKSSAPED